MGRNIVLDLITVFFSQTMRVSSAACARSPRSELLESGFAALRKAIREKELLRPSTRVAPYGLTTLYAFLADARGVPGPGSGASPLVQGNDGALYFTGHGEGANYGGVLRASAGAPTP